jgi:hypothetical protein
MTNQGDKVRLAQAGVHDNPDFILKYLEEIESLAENVLAERREIIELNKRRDKLREASRYVSLKILLIYGFFFLRAIQKQPTNVKMNWLCLNNNFLGIPTKDCKRLIDRGKNFIEIKIISVFLFCLT